MHSAPPVQNESKGTISEQVLKATLCARENQSPWNPLAWWRNKINLPPWRALVETKAQSMDMNSAIMPHAHIHCRLGADGV
jgi:hypothetical protein